VRSGYWQDLTTTEAAALSRASTVVVMPVAAVEQHGPHLPLATDAIINAGVVAAALALPQRRARVLVLPAMNVGHSPEHDSFAGTLSADAATLIALWTDVGRRVARAGIDKLVIFNTHGGQKTLVDLVALQLRKECRMLVARASYFAFGMPPGLFDAEEIANGIHGGEIETSLLLHLAPTLVRREHLADHAGAVERFRARNELLGIEKPVGIGWLSEDLNPAGVVGNAARADAARGAAYLEFLAERLLTLCDELVDPANQPFDSSAR
jgi:creatinine amidohydrolase